MLLDFDRLGAVRWMLMAVGGAVAVFLLLPILFIVALSFVFLDQRLAPIQLVGAGLVLLGVIIAQTSPRPRGAPEPATPLEAEVEG